MGHHCCSKQKVKRGLWSPEEDEKLIKCISIHGHSCWSAVPKLAGLQRCGKSCRLRWINYLRPDLKRGSFSAQEERIIIDVHRILGNRWAQIAKHLPGRTDNEVKNFWNSCIKKKLLAQGLDPKTHNLMPSTKTTSCITLNQFYQQQSSPVFSINSPQQQQQQQIRPDIITTQSFTIHPPPPMHQAAAMSISNFAYQNPNVWPNVVGNTMNMTTPGISSSMNPSELKFGEHENGLWSDDGIEEMKQAGAGVEMEEERELGQEMMDTTSLNGCSFDFMESPLMYTDMNSMDQLAWDS